MITCEEYMEFVKKHIKTRVGAFTDGWQKAPRLGIIQVGHVPASDRYVRGKCRDCEEVGIKATVYPFEEDCTTEQLINGIKQISKDVDGLMVQLPIPDHLDKDAIIKAIPANKDVDGFKMDSPFTPCTPKGIVDYLECREFRLYGMNAVVIGRSDIVGKPMARLLEQRNCTVTLCHSFTKDISMYTKNADLIVVAVGKEHTLTADMIGDRKPIVIDVGINVGEDGKLHGDCDYDALKDKCRLITPVPKGVGLLTRTALLDNMLLAYVVNNTVEEMGE